MEYLFDQSGRGDLLAPVHTKELGDRIPDEPMDESEDIQAHVESDDTICSAGDVNLNLEQVTSQTLPPTKVTGYL